MDLLVGLRGCAAALAAWWCQGVAVLCKSVMCAGAGLDRRPGGKARAGHGFKPLSWGPLCVRDPFCRSAISAAAGPSPWYGAMGLAVSGCWQGAAQRLPGPGKGLGGLAGLVLR